MASPCCSLPTVLAILRISVVTINQSGDDAARILNQKYFLVGMPVGYVKQILGAAHKHLAGTADHFFEPIQFQCFSLWCKWSVVQSGKVNFAPAADA